MSASAIPRWKPTYPRHLLHVYKDSMAVHQSMNLWAFNIIHTVRISNRKHKHKKMSSVYKTSGSKFHGIFTEKLPLQLTQCHFNSSYTSKIYSFIDYFNVTLQFILPNGPFLWGFKNKAVFPHISPILSCFIAETCNL